ncbi:MULTISPECIES: glycosyltransferase family 4 protein [unclassified Agromyces]|uniref:glycosyltransferase family 4 protein n=1 Tax=unclassified Agromyces TaxID=2639701 RepID=UPI0030143727
MPGPSIIHAITPGDHFSPRTGSAIPTVVHGIASAAVASGDAPHRVVIDGSTYRPRYDSAEVVEYTGAPAPAGRARRLDVLRGALGGSRPAIAAYYRPVADAIRGLAPGVVLAHNAPVLVDLLEGSGHRVVLYAHNELLRTYTRAEAGRMLQSAAAIVCVSDSLADATRARLPRPLADRVRVVRNGSDTTRFVPWTDRSAELTEGAAPRPAPVQSGERVRVLFVGRVIPDKGADVLVRAAALVNDPSVEFVVVGSAGFARDAPLSEYEARLRRLAQRSSASIRFEPFVDRASLPAVLADAEVFVIPSRWPDPCPLTVGEGLASGLPIVASRIGGIPEIVPPSSRLVPPGDPAALAREIESLASDPELRRRVGAESRAWAEAHDWTWAWGVLKGALADARGPAS